MKTVIIYGTEHKGSNYNVIQLFKEQLNINENELTEFFLPKDLPYFCLGCNTCFLKGEEFCPHQDYVTVIKNALNSAELFIFTSPVYVFHVTGQMKAFLDHFAFQFMAHRPNKLMFSKTALIVSLGAGGGMASAIKDISDSLSWWGISRIYSFGFAARAAKWEDVTEKNRLKMEQKIKSISEKIKTKINKPKFSIKTKILFNINRLVQKSIEFSICDKKHWENNGWFGKNRPWK
jgi:multimeric flavodoxin WrbA